MTDRCERCKFALSQGTMYDSLLTATFHMARRMPRSWLPPFHMVTYVCSWLPPFHTAQRTPRPWLPPFHTAQLVRHASNNCTSLLTLLKYIGSWRRPSLAYIPPLFGQPRFCPCIHLSLWPKGVWLYTTLTISAISQSILT